MADRVTSGGNEDMKVHGYSGTAVVTGIMHLKGTSKKGAFDRRYRFTDTWLRRLAQQMKLVADNVTVVVLKNTGHWFLEERPKETTGALVNFL